MSSLIEANYARLSLVHRRVAQGPQASGKRSRPTDRDWITRYSQKEVPLLTHARLARHRLVAFHLALPTRIARFVLSRLALSAQNLIDVRAVRRRFVRESGGRGMLHRTRRRSGCPTPLGRCRCCDGEDSGFPGKAGSSGLQDCGKGMTSSPWARY